ncbi:uncharacterized protein LOC133494830 [Syngnathoides biaculeatus]|uniref:uncharacterized protein LOC133494830 n=1 Tax=Syngnathoides biaculeatus TaxID=300417 RepID=UPI002ADE4E0A|nr:uncharacterized protein LOC133494830 [Syngnathoides biaculeatus]
MYLHTYLQANFFTFYVHDGETLSSEPKSLVCDSPQQFKGLAIMDLNQGDLCPFVGSTRMSPTLLPLIQTSRMTEAPEEIEVGRGDGAVVLHRTQTVSGAFDSFGMTTTPSHPRTSTTPLPVTVSHPTSSTAPLSPIPLPATLPLATSATSEVPWTASASSEVPWTASASSEVPWTTSASSEVPWTWGTDKGDGALLRHAPGAGVFCEWLLAGNVCLCVLATASTLVTLLRLAVWYRGAYKLLSVTLARRAGAREVRLCGNREVVYRSVLFVSSRGAEGVKGGPVYKTTLHREPGTQIALQQWSDVMDEGEGGAAWRQRFSVLLRQEREGPGGGREEREWVVGAWLAQHLPTVTPDSLPAP